MDLADKLKQKAEELLPEKRLRHTFGVAKTATEMAKQFGADPQKAYLAGLAHDLLKYLTPFEQLQWVKKSGIIFDNAFYKHPQIWHGFAAAVWIKEEYRIADEEILDAVRYHTTGRAGMGVLEKIVFTADMTEPNRSYADVDLVRTLAQNNLDQAVLYVLHYSVRKLLLNHQAINRFTWEAYNELSMKLDPTAQKEANR